MWPALNIGCVISGFSDNQPEMYSSKEGSRISECLFCCCVVVLLLFSFGGGIVHTMYMS